MQSAAARLNRPSACRCSASTPVPGRRNASAPLRMAARASSSTLLLCLLRCLQHPLPACAPPSWYLGCKQIARPPGDGLSTSNAAPRLQIAAVGLLALDGFKQRLEIALAEAAA